MRGEIRSGKNVFFFKKKKDYFVATFQFKNR